MACPESRPEWMELAGGGAVCYAPSRLGKLVLRITGFPRVTQQCHQSQQQEDSHHRETRHLYLGFHHPWDRDLWKRPPCSRDGRGEELPPHSNRTAVSPEGIKSTCLTIKAVVPNRLPRPAAIFTIIAHVFPSKSGIQQPREPQRDSIKYLESPTAEPIENSQIDLLAIFCGEDGIGRDRADICLKFICALVTRSSLAEVVSLE
ncbi:hypothetical protein K0M31_011377 [Melipona bicolor]|uniref:Uncharacterized protein n=1 Tax=Melipona bicolor TaxID=60889 RepID=A0AA40G9L9_9HYME|nr:hypothetical protein K0M31_011377 [Melipona bicolor]